MLDIIVYIIYCIQATNLQDEITTTTTNNPRVRIGLKN